MRRPNSLRKGFTLMLLSAPGVHARRWQLSQRTLLWIGGLWLLGMAGAAYLGFQSPPSQPGRSALVSFKTSPLSPASLASSTSSSVSTSPDSLASVERSAPRAGSPSRHE
jgi:hypothetical protein